MKCILSGGTGFIGRHIVDRLLQDHHYVGLWTRKPGNETRHAIASYLWDPLRNDPSDDSVNNMDAVIHLAGEPVAQRWNPAVKARIRDSRVLGTRRLVDTIARVRHKPKILISASAIGIYGDRGDEILTESSAPAFRFGLGGRLGSGKQWMPWIHVADIAELVVHALTNDVAGVWNATSPNPVLNSAFTKELARAVHRPALFPVPPFALKLAFGELAQHMLDSARVVPEAALQAGYNFRYPELGPTLADLL